MDSNKIVCTKCGKELISDNSYKYCNLCIGDLMCENMDLHMKRYDALPKQLNTEEILQVLSSIKRDVLDKLEEFENYLKNKRQFKYNKNTQLQRLTKPERQFILERDKFVCRNCNKKYDKSLLHIDHIIPVSKGGTKNPNNLQVLCKGCNMIKSDFLFKDKQTTSHDEGD